MQKNSATSTKSPKNKMKMRTTSRRQPMASLPRTRIDSKLMESMDINLVQAIKEDHADLKAMIETLKSEDAKLAEKRKCYEKFSALLKSHSKAEESVVYAASVKMSELKDETLEAQEEHAVADALMRKIASSEDIGTWKARVKVLAEVVEHHIEEEEKEYLPKLHKHLSDAREKKMMTSFIQSRSRSQKTMTEDSMGILSEVHSEMMH